MFAHTENNTIEINGISIPLSMIKSLSVSDSEVTLVICAEPVSEPEPKREAKPRITANEAHIAKREFCKMWEVGFSCNLSGEEIEMGETVVYFPKPPLASHAEYNGFFKLNSFIPCDEFKAEIEAFKG
jgi:hypothetical protein